MRTFPRTIFASLMLVLVLPAEQVCADAGAVRASERRGDRQITVFTDPTPLRAGPVDVSVLVQDSRTGLVTVSDTIHVTIAPPGETGRGIRRLATGENASNKLFQAAHLEVPSAGWWEITVEVKGPGKVQTPERIVIEVDAAEPLPPWQSMWIWFCWPFAAIAVFAVFKATGRDPRSGSPR